MVLAEAVFGKAFVEKARLLRTEAQFVKQFIIAASMGAHEQRQPLLNNYVSELAADAEGPNTIFRLGVIERCMKINVIREAIPEFESGEIAFHVDTLPHHEGTYEVKLTWTTLDEMSARGLSDKPFRLDVISRCVASD